MCLLVDSNRRPSVSQILRMPAMIERARKYNLKNCVRGDIWRREGKRKREGEREMKGKEMEEGEEVNIEIC
jgi:hypothetical protein